MRRQKGSKRPFRLLMHVRRGGPAFYLRGCNYSDLKRAHHAAQRHCDRWAAIGTTVQVINVDTTRESGSYVRTVYGARYV